jgi:hypothetical protein
MFFASPDSLVLGYISFSLSVVERFLQLSFL